MVKKIVIYFLSWKILLTFIVYFTIYIIPTVSTYILQKSYRPNLPFFIWVWGNFDGAQYIKIARQGYDLTDIPFFPLYPLIMRGISLILKFQYPYIMNGQIISNLSFLIGLFLLYKIMCLDKKNKLFPFLIFVILLYPTSFFYLSVYNDSLFFLLSCTCIYLSRKKHWILASITACFATLTRLNGLVLVFMILGEYIGSECINIRNQWRKRTLIKAVKKVFVLKNILAKKIYAIILIPAAFISYLIWIQRNFGHWYFIFSSMKPWGQDRIIFPLQVFWRYFKIIILYPTFQLNYWIAVIELAFVLLYIFLLFYSFKKIRLSYWLFFLFSIIIPSLTGTFQGMPRYGLHLYPFFLSLSLFLFKSSSLIKTIYFAVSITLLCILLVLFSHGYFVA